MPVELLHMICGYLTPLEVARIRNMGNRIAAIALEYIATTVTLIIEEESFDRLLEIAHHTIISKYVHTLHYEYDFLTGFDRSDGKGLSEHQNLSQKKLRPWKVDTSALELPCTMQAHVPGELFIRAAS